MTPTAQWTPDAESDLEEIVYYIAFVDKRRNVARQIAEGLREAALKLAKNATIGQREPRLGAECRRFTFKRWVILYRPIQHGIAVLRVVGSSRDFDRLFGH
jgi:plasmid stabilization system protein ParE